jgi:hypothetical protein
MHASPCRDQRRACSRFAIAAVNELTRIVYYLAIVPNTDDSIATPLTNFIRVPDYIVWIPTRELVSRDRQLPANCGHWHAELTYRKPVIQNLW